MSAAAGTGGEGSVGLFGSRKERDPSELIRQGDLAGAIELLRKRLKKSPRDRRLRNQLGDALAAARQVEAALKEYQTIAEGYTEDGFTAKALAIWKKMSRLAPGDEELLARIRRAGRDGEQEAAGEAPDELPPLEAGTSVPRTPLFPDFSDEEFLEVARLLDHRQYAEGERIVSEGEPGESLFVIAEGAVTVRMQAGSREMDLATLGPGDFFGEVAILKGRTRTASIDAAEPCELLELSRANLEQIIARHPRVREVMEDFNRRRAESTVEALVEARRSG